MSRIDAQKVTVVLPTYNHAEFLDDAIQSILAQTHKNLELIVVDDGSTDDTPEVLKQYGDYENIRIATLEKNAGKWNALNHGAALSTGEWITSQDADDISLPDRVERQLLCLDSTETIHNLCGFFHCWSEADVETHRPTRAYGATKNMLPAEVRARVIQGFQHPNINHYHTGDFETAGVTSMFHRSMWIMGCRFNPPGLGLRTMLSEDSDFNFRITALLGRTSILMEQLYCYRRGTSTNEEEI